MRIIHSASFTIGVFLLLFVTAINAQSPNWIPPNGALYSYTASVIATIHYEGVRSDNSGDTIAFFVGNELRGLGMPVQIGGLGYFHFITLYSNIGQEQMDVKVYHQSTDLVFEPTLSFTFKAQNIFGTIDTPLEINIYQDNDAPIYFNNVAPQLTIEGLSFQDIDLLEYLVQIDSQGVDWSYTTNPNLTVSFMGSILKVTSAAGFTGQTYLTVRATEQPITTTLQFDRGSGSSRKVSPNPHFAETTIEYNVMPVYSAPFWDPIPSQGVVVGSQFTDVSLHDYENQYGGTVIQYDYKPIIVEKVPADQIPTWSFNKNYSTNMTIIAKPRFTPKHSLDHPDDILVAYINNEIHGLATKNLSNGLYYLTIGDSINNRPITLKFYSGEMKRIFTLTNIFNYTKHQILGSDQNPYSLEFAPIVPMIPSGPYPAGFAVMPIQILDTSYIGTETFEFYAFDSLYPVFLKDEIQASFCVVANTGDLTHYYADLDGDGLGDPTSYILACMGTEGYVQNNDDCDDSSSTDPMAMISIMENSGATPNDGYICANGAVTLTASGGSAYEWSNGSTATILNVMPDTNSLYSVTVTFPTCKGVALVDIIVEGKIVTNSLNEGNGTLRNVLACVTENDTITYLQPSIDSSVLTSNVIIDKNVTIKGFNTLERPKIIFDFNSAVAGFEILATKTLNLQNVDLKTINIASSPFLIGPGELTISGLTQVLRE